MADIAGQRAVGLAAAAALAAAASYALYKVSVGVRLQQTPNTDFKDIYTATFVHRLCREPPASIPNHLLICYAQGIMVLVLPLLLAKVRVSSIFVAIAGALQIYSKQQLVPAFWSASSSTSSTRQQLLPPPVTSVLGAIGNTPLIRIASLSEETECEVGRSQLAAAAAAAWVYIRWSIGSRRATKNSGRICHNYCL
jgi:hypothetical protein